MKFLPFALSFLATLASPTVAQYPDQPATSPQPLPNFPLACQHVAELRPEWNPFDQVKNGNNGVIYTKKIIEWNNVNNQAFPGQTLIYQFVTRQNQHWNMSYTSYQLKHGIELNGCKIVADPTSPTGWWEYWGITIPSTYPIDWSNGPNAAIRRENFFWSYGPADYPFFQPRITSRTEIIPKNITGKDPITCPKGTYVCTAIGEIGWKYNATTGVNKTIIGLAQECYAESLGDINGCESYRQHANRFPPFNDPTEPPVILPNPTIRACGDDQIYQLCTDGKCLLKNQTCAKAKICAETKDCPLGSVCRSADYTDPHSFTRTCQTVNHANYCPTLAHDPWTQAQCDEFIGGLPYPGWTACDQYINTTWHEGCRTDYCQGDCLASYVIVKCEDMLNGSIQACPWGATPGYSPFVPGQCVCSDSWSTLDINVTDLILPNHGYIVSTTFVGIAIVSALVLLITMIF